MIYTTSKIEKYLERLNFKKEKNGFLKDLGFGKIQITFTENLFLIIHFKSRDENEVNIKKTILLKDLLLTFVDCEIIIQDMLMKIMNEYIYYKIFGNETK